MHVYERRVIRLRELLREFSRAEISERSGIAPTTISRYLSDPASSGHKNISEENARKIEAAGRKPENWLDKQHPPEGVSVSTVAHGLSQYRIEDAPLIQWGAKMVTGQLPRVFRAVLPDDAMAPRAQAGKAIYFDSTAAPRPGDAMRRCFR